MTTQSRRSALALTILGWFVVWALVFGPTAGARLPAAPETSAAPPPVIVTPAISEIAPTPAAPQSKSQSQDRKVTVAPGDTLTSLLQGAGVSATQAQAAVDALRPSWDPRSLKIGQEIALTLDPGGIAELRFAPDMDRDIALQRGGDGRMQAQSLPRDLLRVDTRVAGTIATSLFDAATTAGLPPAVLNDMIHAFSYDVDFQREVQPGDSFEVVFADMIENESGKIVGTGDIAYASMILSGKETRLYRYTPRDGSPGFYTASGANVKKALLRTPVDGARISSGFGMRLHPILGYTRLHPGVDFAVPAGTPIYASGDGVVVSAGWNSGGYGNLVVLQHEGAYSTAYAHMSRIAKGLKPGMRVRQGDVIGYVGMTGLATGPHLHYEVRVNAKPINPLSVHMMPAQKLQGPMLVDFAKRVAKVDRIVASLRPHTQPIAEK